MSDKNLEVQTDFKDVDWIIDTLTDENIRHQIMMDGLKAGADVYYNQIISNLKSRLPNSTVTGIKNTGWNVYSWPMINGVKIKEKDDEEWVGVHALSDFRLQFFESGTKGRYTKGHKITGYNPNKKRRLTRTGKGGYRGRIQALHFFSDGILSEAQRATEAIEKSIINGIRQQGIDIK